MQTITGRTAFSARLLLAFAFAAASAHADVKNLSVGVNGVTCPT